MDRPRAVTPLQSAPADALDAFTTDVQAVRADLDATRARFDRAIDGMVDRTRAHARRQRLSALVTALVAFAVCAGAVWCALHLDASVAVQLGPAMERALPVGLVDGGLGLTAR